MKPIKLIIILSTICATNLFPAAEELSEKDEAIFMALDNWNLDKLHRALANGGNVHVIQPSGGNTPLHIAALYGFHDAVELLLIFRANINTLNYAKCTPLHLIAHEPSTPNSEVTSQILMDAGADVTIQDEVFKTPLYHARYAPWDDFHLPRQEKFNPKVAKILSSLGANRIAVTTQELFQANLPKELHEIILGYVGASQTELKEFRETKNSKLEKA